MIGAKEVEIARLLFEEGGWSSGDKYGPDLWFTEDAVMRDIVGHADAMKGLEEIRKFWAGREGPLTLRVPVEEIYVGETGVTILWMAYSQIMDDSAGPENKWKWRCGEGMSWLEFRDGKVCLEVDYWNGMQGITRSWVEHFQGRKRMTREERGAINGA